ncbi:MAG: hypothetical protein M1814_000214 [Vezdaea aestivalis]|nr:MAG: hypothetical protein M1814_000214 [Vezdaea aestivalis]
MVKAIENQAEFTTKVKSNPGVSVVDFHAVWCGPCKAIAPAVEALDGEYTDVTFVKVDVDEQPEIAQEYSVRAMPTFLIFKNGEKVDEVVGANKLALDAAVKKAVA